jgi:hypothetical protein
MANRHAFKLLKAVNLAIGQRYDGERVLDTAATVDLR